MLSQNIHFLSDVRGRTLDKYLAAGWYRIYDLMFTTDSITLGERNIPVQWLRYDLKKLNYSASSRRLLNRNSNLFEIHIGKPALSDEIEALYSRYRKFVAMDMAESVHQNLYSSSPSEIFDTLMIELRDQSTLIGAGFFDVGSDSVAGILNFYDPEFRKYSIGKFLMLVVVEYCLHTGRKYFYPGYVAEGFPKFDYKLTIGSGAELWIDNAWEGK